jgi:hypothetical protein
MTMTVPMEKKPPLSREEKLRLQLVKTQQKLNASQRAAQRIGAQLTKLARSTDTHRKVVAGVWALGKAEADAEFKAMMLRDLNRTLWRDDERDAYGLERLPADIQEMRKPKRGEKKQRPVMELVKN